MEKDFFIITNDSSIGASLAGQLPKTLYRAHTLTSLTALTDGLPATATCIAAMDIDTIEPDIQRIRALKQKYSNLVLLAFSELKFHPEHKDVLSTHFFACLSKPVDVDEMLYLIKDV